MSSSKQEFEAGYPFAVFVREPPMPAVWQEVHDAATAIAPHLCTQRVRGPDKWTRFGFRSEGQAAAFRERARELCPEGIEPGDPL